VAWWAGAGASGRSLWGLGARSGARPQGQPADTPTPTAFGWATARMRTTRGRTKHSKKDCINYLTDKDTGESMAFFALSHMTEKRWFKSVFEYGAAMRKFTSLGRYDIALELWNELRAKNIDADEFTYAAALAAMNVAEEDPKKVQELIMEMETNVVLPNRYASEQALMSFKRAGMWQESINILSKMWESGENPDEFAYQLACDSCENAGQEEKRAMLFEQMRSMNSYLWLQEEQKKRIPTKEPPLAADAPWRPRGAAAPGAFDVPAWHPEYLTSPRLSEEDLREQAMEEARFYEKEEGYLAKDLKKKAYKLPWRKVERIRRKRKNQEANRLALEEQIEERDGPAWRKSRLRY